MGGKNNNGYMFCLLGSGLLGRYWLVLEEFKLFLGGGFLGCEEFLMLGWGGIVGVGDSGEGVMWWGWGGFGGSLLLVILL